MSRHIVVIHRWRDRYADYAAYIDHRTDHVSYVTTELGVESVPVGAAAVRLVPATDDADAVRVAVDELTTLLGAADHVVALNEGDLDTAALIRDYLGCPGQHPAQLVRFRDKLVMAETVAAAGVSVPPFADAPDDSAVLDFAQTHGWPLVVKPRRGTASRGVVVLNSATDLTALHDQLWEPRLVQVFCPDPIVHIDGLWTGTELGPWRASRYLNTCVGFTRGDLLGSVEIDDERLLSAMRPFVAATAGALSAEPWVFHAEAFLDAGRPDSPRLTFLEAGYRVGGAEIPFVWREVHNVDLMRAAVDVQLGRRPATGVPDAWRTAGWLLVPTPVPAPCVVVAAELDDGSSLEDGPYASIVPPVGALVPRIGGYEHVGARFRFRGDSSDAVERALTRTAARFRLDCEPVEPALAADHVGSVR